MLVSSVTDNSAAAKAGLKAGDVITSFNGTVVIDPSDVRRRVAELSDGDEFTIAVLRDKKAVTLKGKAHAPRGGVRCPGRSLAEGAGRRLESDGFGFSLGAGRGRPHQGGELGRDDGCRRSRRLAALAVVQDLRRHNTAAGGRHQGGGNGAEGDLSASPSAPNPYGTPPR